VTAERRIHGVEFTVHITAGPRSGHQPSLRDPKEGGSRLTKKSQVPAAPKRGGLLDDEKNGSALHYLNDFLLFV